MSIGRVVPSTSRLLLFAVATWLLIGAAGAQTLSASIDASLYGYLDQYSMNTENNFVGDEACVPTSSTNAMTLLQNLYPSIYGTSLTGTTYSNWHDTDNTLISLYGTTGGNNGGTYDNRFVNEFYKYIVVDNGFTNTTFAGVFPSNDGWTVKYPAPSWVTFGEPTANFLYNSLVNASGLLLGISYSNSSGVATSGGHELLANGIVWDTTTNTGTISFIDPLDPSSSKVDQAATYINGSSATPATAYDQSTGPALGTTGKLSLTSNGTLLLEYDQYDVTGITVPNPTSANYDRVYATIDTALSVGVVPEPSTYALLVLGFVFYGVIAYRRKKLGLQ